MKGLKLLKSAALSLACCGVLSSQLLAAGPQTATKTSTISDVALAQNGILVGQLVDKQGRGVEGAVVSVQFGKREIARTVTNEKGLYRVQGLRGGVHQVVAGRQSQVFRFWNADTAPPAAKTSALTVLGSNGVVRGQLGTGGTTNLLSLGAGAAGLGVGISNNSKLNDLEDEVKKNAS
ncbi:MAG: carboxypeptidase-like regulatory domain-containing protein [Planctomycetota bacterium]|nr:carboxypeptidase-like regulatory domain-containing protein [Planctomycetota bacterium]